MAQNEDDELVQEQRVLELQLPQIERVPSEVSMVSSNPSSIGDGDSSTSSPPRQRRRVQQTPERPIRFVGTPVTSPPRGTVGAYTPRNLRRLAFDVNPFYERSQRGTAERALQDMMAEDELSRASNSSGSQSVDLFGANEIRGRAREPEPLPLTRLPPGNALFRQMSKDNLAELSEMEDELRSPAPPGSLFADTLKTPERTKKGGIKSKLKKSKSKRSKRTRKTKRRTRKSKQRKIKKKKKTIKKKKAGRKT